VASVVELAKLLDPTNALAVAVDDAVDAVCSTEADEDAHGELDPMSASTVAVVDAVDATEDVEKAEVTLDGADE
jgi:hypothetical protein